MRIFLIISAIVVTYVVGYSYYAWSKLSPVMNNPSVSLPLVPYELKPYDGPTREINLGFARFKLPAEIVGEPVQLDDTLFVAFDQGTQSYPIFFGPPILDIDQQIQSTLEQYNQLSDETITSLFELKKRALRTMPFPFWSLLTRGVKKTTTEAIMLLLKTTIIHPAERSAMLYENDRVGILILEGAKLTIISIYDKKSQSTHELFLESGLTKVDPVVSALATSYQFTSQATTEEQLLAELRATGTPTQSTENIKNATAGAAPERLQQVADEILRRRALRQQEPQK